MRAAASAEPGDHEVQRVLSANSLFAVLELEPPTWDAIGRPSWPLADKVAPAFRRLSFQLHPDRTSHPNAPRAFQILKRAKEVLHDPLEREKYVLRYVADQRSLPQNSVWAGQGSASDRVRAQVEHNQEVKELRKADALERQNLILEQTRQRRLLAESKSLAALELKRRRDADARASDDDDDQGEVQPHSQPKGKLKSSKPFRRAFL